MDTGLNAAEAAQHARLTLRKSFKLRHRTLVQGVFEKGKSVYSGHLRIAYRTLNREKLAGSFRGAVPDRIGPLQVMITVPKKKRRHAVDRVLMRRRIREAFRLQCRELRALIENDSDMRTLSLAIIYMSGENEPMSEIYAAVGSALGKIIKRLTAPVKPLDTTPQCGTETEAPSV